MSIIEWPSVGMVVHAFQGVESFLILAKQLDTTGVKPDAVVFGTSYQFSTLLRTAENGGKSAQKAYPLDTCANW